MKRLGMKKKATVRLVVLAEAIECRNIEVSFTMITDTDLYEDGVLAQMDQGISYSKCMYFLTEVLNDSIVYDYERSADVHRYLAQFENNLAVVPDISDGTLVALIMAKLSSLCKPNTFVDTVEITDCDDGVGYELMCTDANELSGTDLPDKDMWMGKLSFWDAPWWYRDDASTWDASAETEDELRKWRVENKERQLNGSDTIHNVALNEIERQLKSKFRQLSVSVGTPETSGELIEVDFGKRKTALH